MRWSAAQVTFGMSHSEGGGSGPGKALSLISGCLGLLWPLKQQQVTKMARGVGQSGRKLALNLAKAERVVNDSRAL